MRGEPGIVVLMGGDSAEAEVSLSSGKAVQAALEERFARVEGLELRRVSDHEPGNGWLASSQRTGVQEELTLMLRDARHAVVFPMLHGPPGEDGTLQGFLDILGYPYVGSGVRASALAMDKIIAKQVFRAAGLAVAADCVVGRGERLDAAAERILGSLGERVVVKPASQGSALGVALVDEARQLRLALEAAFVHDERLLVEKRLTGREVTVGVLDTDQGPVAFPVIEIITPGDSWYDYEHRYTQGLSEHLMPADLPPAQTAALQQAAVAAHQALGCRDLSRADFIATDQALYLLEVNTVPGMTPTSLYPDGARGQGLPFPDLCELLVDRAIKRAP